MIIISTNSIDKKVGIEYRMHTNKNGVSSVEKVLVDEHKHDGYDEIMVILRGSLYHLAEGVSTFMDSGTLFFLPSGSVHRLIKPSEDLYFLNLSILPSVLDEVAHAISISNRPTSISVARVQPYIVEYLLKNHECLTNSYDPDKSVTIIRNTLCLLLPLCCDHKTPNDWFDNLLFMMKKKENFQVGVRRMHELAFCSSAHLCRVCKARTGLTPTQYVDRIRIKHASNLLKHTNKSIQDVCVECGYETIGNFYKCFKQELGISPGKYKKLYE